MTGHPLAGAAAVSARGGTAARWPLYRWFVSAASLSVPQAAGPVAFSLLALSVTGDTRGGAAMILAMTLSQVAGAIPITRMGNRLPPARLLRWLVVLRTLALMSVVLLAACGASFAWLIACATVAGSVNGAAHGYLRSVLNHLVPASGLPRALGISATLNETTFVLAPVAASGLGAISPLLGILVIAALGAAPAFCVPHVDAVPAEEVGRSDTSVLSPSILLWLACATAGGAVIAAIEIGAVALALDYGYEPTLAILFTVPLCLASVTGGVWVSVRNRMASRGTVVGYLSIMALGSGLAALGLSVASTVAGAILIGFVLAPLGTHYSLVLDGLAPAGRRAEVFALLRTANAVGVICASAILTALSLSSTLTIVTGLMVAAASTVAFAHLRGSKRLSSPSAAQTRDPSLSSP